MSISTTAPPSAPPTPVGRGYLWLGVLLGVIGIPLMMAQMAMKITITPWYIPTLTTLGAFLVLFAQIQWASITRTVMLLALFAFAGLQWFMLIQLAKLPEYTGPVHAGGTVPAFTAKLASGEPFTEKDLTSGKPTALVFTRGRW